MALFIREFVNLRITTCTCDPLKFKATVISSDIPLPHYDFLIKVCPIYYTISIPADRSISCATAFALWYQVLSASQAVELQVSLAAFL